jgi:hypothetical protein
LLPGQPVRFDERGGETERWTSRRERQRKTPLEGTLTHAAGFWDHHPSDWLRCGVADRVRQKRRCRRCTRRPAFGRTFVAPSGALTFGRLNFSADSIDSIFTRAVIHSSTRSDHCPSSHTTSDFRRRLAKPQGRTFSRGRIEMSFRARSFPARTGSARTGIFGEGAEGAVSL